MLNHNEKQENSFCGDDCNFLKRRDIKFSYQMQFLQNAIDPGRALALQKMRNNQIGSPVI
jgi:hypothetical protein